MRVRISSRADEDIDQIYAWLAQRSPHGAANWFRALITLIRDVGQFPERGLAPESRRLMLPLRQAIFRTQRGRSYRILYLIDHDEVLVLRVRRPGQRAVGNNDLGLPSTDG